MSQRIIQVCDICGTVKQETNHWFKVAVISEGQSPMFVTIPASMEIAAKDVKDVCGQQHAQTLYSRYLDHGTIEEKIIEEMPDLKEE